MKPRMIDYLCVLSVVDGVKRPPRRIIGRHIEAEMMRLAADYFTNLYSVNERMIDE
jgi:hypothetical protein